MQIQRIQTLHETVGRDGVNEVGSKLLTKDYFESNPVFYYCYRIFPFERGHGIFVANSIRRFLLYEIPTIAITSVLIHPIRSMPLESELTSLKDGEEEKQLQTPEGTIESLSPRSLIEPVGAKKEKRKQSEVAHEIGSGTITETGKGKLKKDNVHPTKLAGVQAQKSTVRPQVKKKKVTKKALKEQAAELFSYTFDPFDPNELKGFETEEVSSLTEFTTIPFVRESFLEILLNLKACVFENTFAFDEPPGERSSKILKGKLILNASQESINDPREISQELFFQTDFKKHVEDPILDEQLNPFHRSPDPMPPNCPTKPNGPTEPNEVGQLGAVEQLGSVGQETRFTGSAAIGQLDSGGAYSEISSVSSKGRRVREYKIWAKDLILPPGLKVRNPDLVLATLVAPQTNCELELSFEKIFQPDLTTLSMKTGRTPHRAEVKRRNVPLDGTLFPIKKVNFALSYTKFQKELITFEIWTNGALDPREAIFHSVEKILGVFQTLRSDQVKEIDPFAETALDEFEDELTAANEVSSVNFEEGSDGTQLR